MNQIFGGFRNVPRSKRIAFILALLITLSATVLLSTLAWFTSKRKAGAMAKINAPFNLFLNAANKEDLAYFDLSDIDVGDASVTYHDYVFCVSGSWDIKEYYLQLAHTTNIPFKYTIYRVEEGKVTDQEPEDKTNTVSYTIHENNSDFEVGDPIYVTYTPSATYQISTADSPCAYGKVCDENDYVNKKTSRELSGVYLAKSQTSDHYYGNTYDSVDNGKVQEYAVPLYMQSGLLERGTASNGEFCDYYVLHISWDHAIPPENNAQDGRLYVRNNKETDIVYITAAERSEVE